MLHWLPTLFLSVFLILFSLSMLAFAIYIEALIVGRIAANLWRWEYRKFLGTAAVAVILGTFAFMVGSGAWNVLHATLVGLIGRFL